MIFGNLGTNVANGSIRILTFGYQCCKWIDPNIDIWKSFRKFPWSVRVTESCKGTN